MAVEFTIVRYWDAFPANFRNGLKGFFNRLYRALYKDDNEGRFFYTGNAGTEEPPLVFFAFILLLCPEYPIPSVAEAWHYVTVVVEMTVHGAGDDFDVGVREFHFLHSRRR